MFPITAMPMPGALRLRAVHPLIEGDGSCGLIYDLERGAVVEVPEELQFHIAPALETGDLDECVLGWLANEDLLTGEGGAGWTTLAEGSGALELTGSWSAGEIYRVDDELHVRIEHAREDAALEIIGCVLQQSGGNGRVKLHLSWSGAFPGRSVLERIVCEASRQAARLRQEIAFELTLDAREVTPAVAGALAGLALQVRLLCGSYPARTGELYGDVHAPAWEAEPAVGLLLERLGERLTVHCVLDQGRLLDAWEWAKRAGVRHLDATVLEDSALGQGAKRLGRPRETRNDMMAVSDETADALSTQTLPVDFKPLTRIVDRLMRSEPLDRLYGESTSFGGLMPVADVYPRSFLDRLDIRPAPGPWEEMEMEAEDATAGSPCQGCWARHVCSHSTYVASPLDKEDLREPSEERCGLWRTEVEVALRFYHRLAHADPLQVRRFFEDSAHEPGPILIRREDLDHLRMPF